MKKLKASSLLINMAILLALIIVTITIVTSLIITKKNEIKSAVELSQYSREQILKTDNILESLFSLESRFKEYCITSKKTDFVTYKVEIKNLIESINDLKKVSLPPSNGKNDNLIKLINEKEDEESKYAKIRQLTDSLLFTSSNIEENKEKSEVLQQQIQRLSVTIVPKVTKTDTITTTKTIGTKKKGLFGRIKTFIVGENTEQKISTKVTTHASQSDTIKQDSIVVPVQKAAIPATPSDNEKRLQRLIQKNLELKETEIKLIQINNRLINEMSQFIYSLKNTARNDESNNNNLFVNTVEQSVQMLQFILMALIVLAFALSIYIWRLAYKNDLSQKRIISLNQQILKDSKDKDKFFSIISHDLMNPFNVLLGFSELLVDTIKSDQKNDSIEYASIIQQSTKRIFGLLQNLLVWSKTQNRKIKYTPTEVNIEHLTNDSMSALLSSAMNKGIEIQHDISKDLSAKIDYNMISSVLRNLVTNSIKFSTKGGIVKIKSFKKQNNLVFEISDTGVGMNSNQLNELFKLDKTITTKGTAEETGSGLGLIICKEFIDIHKGNIEVTSDPGKGSTFTITLPLYEN